jgi:hypothetical protein
VCYYKEPAENGIFNKNEGGFDILPTNPTTVERINELQVRIVLNEEQLTSLFEQIKGRLYHKRERM